MAALVIRACFVIVRLSLIATASSDRTLRLWDYQRLELENIIHDNSREVTSLEFLGPYPLLISADSAGRMRGWLTRPVMSMGQKLVFTVYNSWIPNESVDDMADTLATGWAENDGPTSGNEPVNYAITVMTVFEPPGTSRLEVFTGDEKGVIKR
jgi:WD40 repeat protein